MPHPSLGEGAGGVAPPRLGRSSWFRSRSGQPRSRPVGRRGAENPPGPAPHAGTPGFGQSRARPHGARWELALVGLRKGQLHWGCRLDALRRQTGPGLSAAGPTCPRVPCCSGDPAALAKRRARSASREFQAGASGAVDPPRNGGDGLRSGAADLRPSLRRLGSAVCDGASRGRRCPFRFGEDEPHPRQFQLARGRGGGAFLGGG